MKQHDIHLIPLEFIEQTVFHVIFHPEIQKFCCTGIFPGQRKIFSQNQASKHSEL